MENEQILAADSLVIKKVKDYLNGVINTVLECSITISDDDNDNIQTLTRFCSSSDLSLLFLFVSASDKTKGKFVSLNFTMYDNTVSLTQSL